MSARRYLYGTEIRHFGQDGSAVPQIFEWWDFTGQDCRAFQTHILRVSVSVQTTNPAALLALDFLDADHRLQTGTNAFAVKRVFYDDGGVITTFVSDCLGHGWAVPPKANGQEPMLMRLEADGGGQDLGPSAVILERWWEARAVSRCSDD